MIVVKNSAHRLVEGALVPCEGERVNTDATMAGTILAAHNIGEGEHLKIQFDAMASHDITYVSIIQNARLGGLERFPIPYVLTNCHNSLCAVGGTINEDDHAFGLSAARRYGGEFVPAHLAVIHQYMRERYAAPGKMILASDSHTRYGPCGCLSVGEGGPELAKQLLGRTYDLAHPEICAVWLDGKPHAGVGPQDVALALIGATFGDGLVKNKILEFIGPGVANLSMDYRFGIDVMTTETTCLSTVWRTDRFTRDWLAVHGRRDEYVEMNPSDGAGYDMAVFVDLSAVEPMIALPFHPSNVYTIRDFKQNALELLAAVEQEAVSILGLTEKPDLMSKLRDGGFYVDQGFVGGCSGGLHENIRRVADILRDGSTGCGAFNLSVYPASNPMMLKLIDDGDLSVLTRAGVSIRSAFCGPCFGAGDVPQNGGFSIRHSTRNFPNREGSRPSEGQSAFVALMDARSIAATARNGGRLTGADELENSPHDTADTAYTFDRSPYHSRVYYGFGKPDKTVDLVMGPNITDFPDLTPLADNLIIEVASAIYDAVTTTDELIPSGETSSYRSNPRKLATFTLSRKDPGYTARAAAVMQLEEERRNLDDGEPSARLKSLLGGMNPATVSIGSAVFALRPGDGSAREQAASCQRVLGGVANIAGEYATKRYRSNLVNWGMLPFVIDDAENRGIATGDVLIIPNIRAALAEGKTDIAAKHVKGIGVVDITLKLPLLTAEEREVIFAGCLMNYYANP